MNTALSQKELEEMLNTAVQEVTEKASGVRLHQGGAPPGKDFCTIHITFKKGFRSSLSLCADTAMLTRMTQNAIQRKIVTPQDLEDFAKEYLNVLCGRVSAALYRATKVATRFSVPIFHRGSYEPEGQRRQFVLNFSDDQSHGVQLIHHVPCLGREDDASAEITIA